MHLLSLGPRNPTCLQRKGIASKWQIDPLSSRLASHLRNACRVPEFVFTLDIDNAGNIGFYQYGTSALHPKRNSSGSIRKRSAAVKQPTE
jgi:hypothetical protein